MNVANNSFIEVVSRSCGIVDVKTWLDRQREADYPDPHWDAKETGVLDLSEIEDAFESHWREALEKYAVPITASELKNFGSDDAIVNMADCFTRGGARVYPVSNGIAAVFPGDQFSAVFFDAHDETYHFADQNWQALYCILGTWRSGPTIDRCAVARKFLCDLFEEVMNKVELAPA